MKVILIRHGLTDYNLNKRYCGFKDIALNKTGRAQAERLRYKLRGLKIDRVFCSDLKRSWQTAKIIFGDTGCPIVKNPNLREINFGVLEGLTFEEIMKKHPDIYRRWLKDPFNTNIPQGESLGKLRERVFGIFNKILSLNKNKTVAVVTHAGPIRIILSNILKIKNIWQISPEPASVNIIEF